MTSIVVHGGTQQLLDLVHAGVQKVTPGNAALCMTKLTQFEPHPATQVARACCTVLASWTLGPALRMCAMTARRAMFSLAHAELMQLMSGCLETQRQSCLPTALHTDAATTKHQT